MWLSQCMEIPRTITKHTKNTKRKKNLHTFNVLYFFSLPLPASQALKSHMMKTSCTVSWHCVYRTMPMKTYCSQHWDSAKMVPSAVYSTGSEQPKSETTIENTHAWSLNYATSYGTWDYEWKSNVCDLSVYHMSNMMATLRCKVSPQHRHTIHLY